MPVRAVCFDFDGVIADTENIHVAAWQRTLAALGWQTADEVCARAAAIDDRVFLAEVFQAHNISGGDVDGWVRRKQQLTAALLADSPRIYPGVGELVAKLHGRVKLAVVSTTWHENIEIVLKAGGLRDAFDTLVGKEDFQAVKPDPECYRLALAKLQVSALEAMALEDSPSGLAAARGAGMQTLAVGHRLGRGEWTGSSPYVDDLASPTSVLEMLGLD